MLLIIALISSAAPAAAIIVTNVVEVRMAHDYRVQASLIDQIQLAGQRTGVDREAFVDQKRGCAMPWRLTAVTSENPEIHPPSLFTWGCSREAR